jgi:AcrR family transcriptional regulator
MDQTEREARIEAAAYAVLRDKGFKGASMLAIAKAAKASNETLYKFYGNKIGLFSAMIRSNTARVEDELAHIRGQSGQGPDVLRYVAQALLQMVTSEQAIALNRAAAGDVSGELGAELAQEGRARLLPLFQDLIRDLYGPTDDVAERVECFIALLIGDLQIRRAIHEIAPLTATEIDERVTQALTRLQKIYPFPAN